MVLDLDRELAKDRRRRLLIFLLLLLIFFFILGVSFLRVLRSSPTLQVAWGEIEIFVDGVWIPLGAGIDIKNIEGKKLRVKGEIVIAGRRIKGENAVIEFEKKNINVISGKVEVVFEDKKVSLEAGKKLDIASFEVLTQEGVKMETKPKKQAYLKSITIDVQGKSAFVKIVAPGTQNVVINGAKFFSEGEGVFKITVPLEEGENTLHILGFDETQNLVFRRTEKVFIDTTPPEIKSLEMFWE